MLTVAAALDAILGETGPLAAVAVPLVEALGLVTAEAVTADVDSPPFDKALMDGFAVRSADLAAGRAHLRILEQVIAGSVPTQTVIAGTATQIMTGAPMPHGADAVVKIEDARFDGTDTVEFSAPIRAGANLLRRGTSLKSGQPVLAAGRLLRPQELGALAEVGKHRLLVHPRPTVAVIATGNELVPIDQFPGPGQIRNSNEALLCALVHNAGGIPRALGVARDERPELRARIAAGLDCDVLLLSGGVSEGTHDLVPSELAAAGVRKVFHKIELRPGKPLWFGILDRIPGESRSPDGAKSRRCTAVFGLPGNPVSSLVCFELFVRTCLRRLRGIKPSGPVPLRARLVREHVAQGERPTYNPARLTWDENGPRIEPVPWHGSSDLQATINANAMGVFPAGDATYPAGSVIDVISWA